MLTSPTISLTLFITLVNWFQGIANATEIHHSYDKNVRICQFQTELRVPAIADRILVPLAHPLNSFLSAEQAGSDLIFPDNMIL